MPRAPRAPIDSEGQLAEVGALQCTRGRQLTARCCGDSQRGGVTVLAVFGAMAAVIVVSHALADTSYRGPPKPPPPPCGTWAIIDGRESGPGERPCSRCKYGAEFTHVVTTDDLNNDNNKRYGPCDTLADRFGVPQFEIWNLNKSTSCCENPLHVEVTDVLEICKPPTLAQWKAEGHPKKAPKKVVFSYIGALGGAIAPLPTWAPLCCQSNACKNNEDCRAEGNQLPDSINVAVIGPIDDTTSTTGVFRVTPPIRGIGGFAGNCSVGINPAVVGRGKPGEPEAERVWLLSLLPLNDAHGFRDNGNWGKDVTPEDWGATAAESLEKIILRYRLDGMDLNIEQKRTHFAQYICSMFRHLNARMGGGLIFTGTPYSHSWAPYSDEYADLATTCLDEIAWINWQTYDDYDSRRHTLNHPEYIKRTADVFGWNRTTWGVSTQHGSPRPLAPAAVAIAERYPESRGIFVWTAENSAKCSPKWCMEDLISAKMEGTDLPALQAQCQCLS